MKIPRNFKEPSVKNRRLFYFLAVAAILFSSCSVTKRKYTNGLFIEWNYVQKHTGVKSICSNNVFNNLEKKTCKALKLDKDLMPMISEKEFIKEKAKPFEVKTPLRRDREEVKRIVYIKKLKSKVLKTPEEKHAQIKKVKRFFLCLILAGILLTFVASGIGNSGLGIVAIVFANAGIWGFIVSLIVDIHQRKKALRENDNTIQKNPDTPEEKPIDIKQDNEQNINNNKDKLSGKQGSKSVLSRITKIFGLIGLGGAVLFALGMALLGQNIALGLLIPALIITAIGIFGFLILLIIDLS